MFQLEQLNDAATAAAFQRFDLIILDTTDLLAHGASIHDLKRMLTPNGMRISAVFQFVNLILYSEIDVESTAVSCAVFSTTRFKSCLLISHSNTVAHASFLWCRPFYEAGILVAEVNTGSVLRAASLYADTQVCLGQDATIL